MSGRKLADEFQVGVVAKPHGIHGEVNVFPTTDDPSRFRELKEVVLVHPKEGRRTLAIEGVKFVQKFAVLKFKGLDTVESVERYRSCPLMVDRAHAIPLQEGEYYVADIIGLSVVDEEGGRTLGEIVDVIETGANDVYEMRDGDGRSVMIPAIRDCIRRVDIEEGILEIHVMKGLLPDLESENAE
ncbi:MAG: ribosome maturation factor RimM [Lachnospiraceae bacterium]|nr:ribosome maturation factor RimM [Lachnospiraceae bacterium]